MLFGNTAESTYTTIQYHHLTDVRLDLWAHRWRLRRLGALIDQLERSPDTTDIVLSVTDVHDLLADALDRVLHLEVEALHDACQQFLDGRGPAALRDHHTAVAEVLAMIAALGPPPRRVPVTVPHDIAEQVQQVADRTGYPAEEIAMVALARQSDQPDEAGGR